MYFNLDFEKNLYLPPIDYVIKSEICVLYKYLGKPFKKFEHQFTNTITYTILPKYKFKICMN